MLIVCDNFEFPLQLLILNKMYIKLPKKFRTCTEFSYFRVDTNSNLKAVNISMKTCQISSTHKNLLYISICHRTTWCLTKTHKSPKSHLFSFFLFEFKTNERVNRTASSSASYVWSSLLNLCETCYRQEAIFQSNID